MQVSESKTKILLLIVCIALLVVYLLGSQPLLMRLFAPHLFAYDAKRVFELGLLSLFALMIIAIRPWRVQLLNTWNCLPILARSGLIVFLLLGLLSCQFAAFRLHFAYLEVALYSLLFLTLGLGVASLVKDQIQFSAATIAWIFYIIAVLYNLLYFSILVNFTWIIHMPHNPFAKGFFPGFMNIRFFMQMQIWTLPILIYPLTTNLHKITKFVLGFVAACWWSLMLTNNSRGAILALIISYLIIIIFYRKQARSFLWVSLAVFLMAIVIYMVTFLIPFNAWHNVFSQLGNGVYTDRTAMWIYVLKLTYHHPLLGVGPMHYAYQAFPAADTFVYHGHPHNGALLILCEWGIPAALIFYALLIWGAYSWFKRLNLSSWSAILTTAVLSGALYSFVTGMFVMPLAQITTCLFLGLAFGYHFQKKEVALKNVLIKEGVLIAILAIAVIYCWMTVIPQLSNLATHEILQLQLFHYPSFAPRFWLQGIIT